MGNRGSTLSTEQVEELEVISYFRRAQLERVAQAFFALDTHKRHCITTTQLLSLPHLMYNPYLPRLVDVFHLRVDSFISLKRFVQILSVFAESAPRDHKLRFLFKVYDADGDGLVSASDMSLVIKLVVKEQLTDKEIAYMVEQAMAEVQLTDGKLGFEEFSKVALSGDVLRKVRIDF